MPQQYEPVGPDGSPVPASARQDRQIGWPSVASVSLEREGPIAWLRMNRPDAHNAFSNEMTALMADRVRELTGDRDARAALLCGNGPSFSTGVDVKELASGEIDVELFIAWHRMARALRALEIPLIVAIHGHCLGGRLMLTLIADYRLASSDARLGLGALRHGILPGSAPELLPTIVGVACARRLCIFGERLDAEEALRIRLVDRVVPSETLEDAARELAEQACSLSPTAVRECKALIARAASLDADSYERAYREAQQRCLNARDST
jgi:enoyl-CoA hydratase/carnithine racemase